MTETSESTTTAPEAANGSARRTGGLSSMLLADLKTVAGGLGISGASSMKKAQLLDAIKAAQSNSGQSNSGQSNSGQGNSGQGNSGQGNSGQSTSSRGNSSRGSARRTEPARVADLDPASDAPSRAADQHEGGAPSESQAQVSDKAGDKSAKSGKSGKKSKSGKGGPSTQEVAAAEAAPEAAATSEATREHRRHDREGQLRCRMLLAD